MRTDTATKLGLRLYQDGSGVVWSGAENASHPTASDLSPREFLRQAFVRDARALYVLGLRSNAELLCAIAESATSACELPSTWIATPAVCDRDLSADNVMRQMRTLVGVPASVGGWHKMSAAVAAQYELVLAVERAEGKYTSLVRQKLREHPAYPALSFIPTLDESEAAKLLHMIVDPRWYIDPRNPDRLSRLRRYLGLREQNIRMLHAMKPGKGQKGRYYNRALTVLTAWSGNKQGLGGLDDPQQFLWRCLREEAGNVRALQASCNLFISFIREFWVGALSQVDGYFVPKYFFSNAAEAAAFEIHTRSMTGK